MVTALDVRDGDSQMYNMSLTDFPGKDAPFGREISNLSMAVNTKSAFRSRRSFMSDRICSAHFGT